ncbi:hypothetical protein B0H13DRAFT_2496767 [Mycena leptocephala]|nr:hypothetical protein B0H13DRAFT_2496767 [Mycena leptocephala]
MASLPRAKILRPVPWKSSLCKMTTANTSSGLFIWSAHPPRTQWDSPHPLQAGFALSSSPVEIDVPHQQHELQYRRVYNHHHHPSSHGWCIFLRRGAAFASSSAGTVAHPPSSAKLRAADLAAPFPRRRRIRGGVSRLHLPPHLAPARIAVLYCQWQRSTSAVWSAFALRPGSQRIFASQRSQICSSAFGALGTKCARQSRGTWWVSWATRGECPPQRRWTPSSPGLDIVLDGGKGVDVSPRPAVPKHLWPPRSAAIVSMSRPRSIPPSAPSRRPHRSAWGSEDLVGIGWARRQHRAAVEHLHLPGLAGGAKARQPRWRRSPACLSPRHSSLTDGHLGERTVTGPCNRVGAANIAHCLPQPESLESGRPEVERGELKQENGNHSRRDGFETRAKLGELNSWNTRIMHRVDQRGFNRYHFELDGTFKTSIEVNGTRAPPQDRRRHYFERATTEPPDGEMDEQLSANTTGIAK